MAKRFALDDPAVSRVGLYENVAFRVVKDATATESGACPPLENTPAPTGFGMIGLEAAPMPISSTLAKELGESTNEKTTTSLVTKEMSPRLPKMASPRAAGRETGSRVPMTPLTLIGT